MGSRHLEVLRHCTTAVCEAWQEVSQSRPPSDWEEAPPPLSVKTAQFGVQQAADDVVLSYTGVVSHIYLFIF